MYLALTIGQKFLDVPFSLNDSKRQIALLYRGAI